MTRIFAECSDAQIGGMVVITGDNASHISKSLRMRAGEKVTVCDGKRRDLLCTITGFTSEYVMLKVDDICVCTGEPKYNVTLYMALPKADKMEIVVQKAVETGVTSIVPVMLQRCITRPNEKSLDAKISRWNKISEHAACQSGRGIIPAVMPLTTFKDAIANMAKDDLSFVCYEGERNNSLYSLLRSDECKKINTISFMVGAEGGFAQEEVDEATENSIKTVSLGRRILRCETAPLYVLTSISLVYDE